MKFLRAVIATLAAAILPNVASAATLTIVCGGALGGIDLCREGAEAWARAKGHEVRVIRQAENTNLTRRLYADLFAAAADDIDVLELDIVWPATLAKHLLDLKPVVGGTGEHFTNAVEAFTVGGRLLAVPWYVNIGRLFYRSDLLEKYQLAVPQTWEEFAASARTVQDGERAAGNGGFFGYVFEGQASEGLTCNALEWFASHAGPGLVAADGAVVVNNANNKAALAKALSWLGAISPPALLDMGGEKSVRFFKEGNAAFLRYWSDGLALMQAEDSGVRGRVAMAALPKGGADGRHAAAVGGYGLAVSRYSKAPELAADLVAWLTGAEEQKRRALVAGIDPSRPALYEDRDLVARSPHLPALRRAVEEAAMLRPASVTGAKYDEVSEEFREAVHRVLSRRVDSSKALDELSSTLRRMSSSWLN
jgi:trehalose/maltose transport system substrate-binding protein